MAKIEIELDEHTLERAKLLTESRKYTLPELIAEVIKLLAAPKVTKDPWMGLFADEPELVGEIFEEALRNRAAQSFNQTNWTRHCLAQILCLKFSGGLID